MAKAILENKDLESPSALWDAPEPLEPVPDLPPSESETVTDTRDDRKECIDAWASVRSKVQDLLDSVYSLERLGGLPPAEVVDPLENALENAQSRLNGS